VQPPVAPGEVDGEAAAGAQAADRAVAPRGRQRGQQLDLLAVGLQQHLGDGAGTAGVAVERVDVLRGAGDAAGGVAEQIGLAGVGDQPGDVGERLVPVEQTGVEGGEVGLHPLDLLPSGRLLPPLDGHRGGASQLRGAARRDLPFREDRDQVRGVPVGRIRLVEVVQPLL
jgi:hypothetical protein